MSILTGEGDGRDGGDGKIRESNSKFVYNSHIRYLVFQKCFSRQIICSPKGVLALLKKEGTFAGSFKKEGNLGSLEKRDFWFF